MPEFEKEYKKTQHELHDEELIAKDDFGETSAEIEANTTAVLEKYDREANVRVYKGKTRRVVRLLFILFSLYAVFLLFYPGEIRMERASFVGLIVMLVYLNFPVSRTQPKKVNFIPWYDMVLMGLGIVSYLYFVINYRAIIDRGIMLTPLEVWLGVIGILVTLEACRRAVGLPIVIVASIFIVYAMTQKSLRVNVYNLFYTADGIIGTPIRACLNFIVLFVIFGAFLEKTGITQFFIELANSIAGASSGGPAKVAVISSALCGMVSGSSVGNTVTTGSVTIPMMKKTGYKPEFAGAVEAAASTGGQIMPPIMGAAAFLMVEYVTMPDTVVTYGYIALRAILPAVLYFAGIFIMVHLEAKKNNLTGIPREKLPKFWPLFLRNGFLLLPLVALVYFLMTRTMAFAAIAATGLAVLVSMVHKETRIIRIVFHEDVGYRIDFSRFLDALEAGAKSTLTVGVACAVAGVIACVITTTGIGSSLISVIIGASGGYKIVALFLTMLTCIVLGMGVPTTANYVIMATTCAPVLIRMGIPSIAAHMFVFYFGIVADITPPVALAAYAGSAIAHASPMKTGVNATKLAIAAFIIPYMLALNPAMVFVDTTAIEVISIVITSLAGMFGLSMALEGFYHGSLSAVLRVISAVGGLLLIYPGLATDLVGLLLVGGVIAFQLLREKKAAAA
ncbi:MAG: TRAP transporter permease [Eubacteriales bacterium]|nr:TRAP transporter permease [Eubacteriales bacterium]